ncbi:MAG: MBL fold metallo-hydrolase [Erysipelotrichales bacterium]|nr:MBL fold metallo-hydrolase [Erysipelotrichales bacterium]
MLVEKYDIVLIIGKMNIVYFIIYYIIVLLKNGNFRFIYASIMILINYLFVSINIFPEITILDVGQGDSIMVEYPFNKATILIDTGGNLYRDIASEVTIPYLHSKGKKAIDMVFLSHDDFDHSGAFELLSKQAIVREVISEAHENTVFRIDSNNYINLYYIGDYEDENENSLIMCLNFDDLKFFTAGDITKEIENRILRHNLIGKVDLMKLSHHGSATSNSKEFLNYLRPKFAINSSGVNNFYHHPSIEVVNNLEELGIPYLDTQKVGAIQIKFIGEIVLIRTMNNEIYAIM